MSGEPVYMEAPASQLSNLLQALYLLSKYQLRCRQYKRVIEYDDVIEYPGNDLI